MSDDLTTPEALAVATGSYVAAKIFGPSLGRLGENLLVYWERRLPAIFAKADQFAAEREIEPRQISPGLLTRLVIDASMSSEDEELTEWWANLFLSAGTEQFEPNRYAVYSDIMAMLGPNEVAVLHEFVASFQARVEGIEPRDLEDHHRATPLIVDASIEQVFDTKSSKSYKDKDIHEGLLAFAPPVPVRAYEWKLPNPQGTELAWEYHQEDWYVQRQVEFEILERSKVLQRKSHGVPVMANQDSWVGTISLTELGRTFFEACTGQPIIEKKTQ
ncbi:MAG: hypothetical protein AAF697_05915 [Pseudomonadota bacterium]